MTALKAGDRALLTRRVSPFRVGQEVVVVAPEEHGLVSVRATPVPSYVGTVHGSDLVAVNDIIATVDTFAQAATEVSDRIAALEAKCALLSASLRRAEEGRDALLDALEWVLPAPGDCEPCRRVGGPCVGHAALAKAGGAS